MYLLVAGGVIFLFGVLRCRSRFIFALQILWLWLVMGWNCGGIDYVGNRQIFLYHAQFSTGFFRGGWLANILIPFFARSKEGFINYNIVIVLASLLIIAFVILQESQAPCFVMNCFAIYPFLDSIMQKRFFPGMALIVLGFYFLKRGNKALYALCVSLAVGFHFSFVVYFLLLVVHLRKNITKRILVMVLVAEFVFLRYGKGFLGAFFLRSKLERYLLKQQYSSEFIGVVYLISQLMYIVLFYYISVYLVAQNDRCKSEADFVNNLNKISSVLLPLCLYESVFLRYYRPVLIYEFIVLSNIWYESKHGQDGILIVDSKRLAVGVYIVYLITVNVGIYMSASVGFDSILNTMLSNPLFQGIQLQ